MARPSRGSNDHAKWRSVGDVKLVSPISTFVRNALTFNTCIFSSMYLTLYCKPQWITLHVRYSQTIRGWLEKRNCSGQLLEMQAFKWTHQNSNDWLNIVTWNTVNTQFSARCACPIIWVEREKREGAYFKGEVRGRLFCSLEFWPQDDSLFRKNKTFNVKPKKLGRTFR